MFQQKQRHPLGIPYFAQNWRHIPYFSKKIITRIMVYNGHREISLVLVGR